ncbi:MAG: glycosyltransferase [Fluviicola sp.]|nr:glycosyltransferase [Fluviicola sp.]
MAAVFTTIGFMGFGYLTNDLADRKKDALAGKPNGTTNLSTLSILLLIIIFLAIAFLPWFYLPMDQVSVVCIVVELVLFIIYAFPPFRLKEKGFLGVITDALYAHVVPAFLASWTFYLVGKEHYANFFWFVMALSIWQLFSGIRNILSHHYKDFENDQISGTNTFATKVGKEKVYKLMVYFFIPLEVISFLVFLTIVQFEIGFLIIVILIFLFFSWPHYRKNKSEVPTKHFTNIFLDRFYIHWFPYIVLFALAFGSYDFWWIALIHVLLFHPLIGKVIRGINTKKSKSTSEGEIQSKIAILTTNRNQYSETFIQSHIQLLNDVVVYSDGYMPTSISLNRGLTWSLSINSEIDLVQSWKDNNIKVVLAEYGPAGVEVMNLCEDASIPLVVHFHGFDAYRNDVLESYGSRYKELFRIASNIIVVSNDMKKQLLSLGCPNSKIKRITYGVDTELFSPSEANDERNGFIACGRFVPKKSPYSTISAFAKVVEIYPKAKLTFIGDGELLKSSQLLAKELKIESNISFRGVLTPLEVSIELKKHAIFVQHSILTKENDSEGTPLSLLEAAASGLAIVATKHAGIIDVIKDEESGFLVEEGDVQKMSERMIQVFEDGLLRMQLGRRARADVLKYYDQTNYIESLEKCLNEAVIPQKEESGRTIWRQRFFIFLILFLIAEIGLRMVGYKPGVIEDFYFHAGEVRYDSLLYADEVGITHIIPDKALILNGKVNKQGFFSSIEYTSESIDLVRKSGKKVIMLIGDSYTQGCCADEYSGTFAYLLNQPEEYEVLNFGIPGADPVQYRLIVEKYVPLLKPDLIVVAVYGGNDILEYDRSAKPFVPLAYPIENGPWLNSEGPIYLTEQGTFFSTFDEAKGHYFQFFSLWGDESSFFEKTIRYSVILSRPYLKLKTKLRYEEVKNQMPEKFDNPVFSMENLVSLNNFATSYKVPVLFTLIPPPSDVIANIDLHRKYDFVFGQLKYIIPSNLEIENYDGVEDANHFNNQGHQKYASFLKTLIEAKLLE